MALNIYLDNAATTQPTPGVVSAVCTAMRGHYGNPSSLHALGYEAECAVREARGEVAKALGCDAKNLFFTSGGTESNNTAIYGICRKGPRGRIDRIISTAAEHPSVLKPLQNVEAAGWKATYVRLGIGGAVDLDMLESALDDSVALICLTHVNNETGAVLSVGDVKLLRDRKCPSALIHLDCVQSFGKLPLKHVLNIADTASVSAHKIHGPKGIGALYVSDRARIAPLMLGGGQESGIRSGTENTPAIAGFGVAAREAAAGLPDNTNHARHARALRNKMIECLEHADAEYLQIPDGSIDDGSVSPYILLLAFPGAASEPMLNHLSGEGVYVSSGAACSARRAGRTGSHVLNAMGISPEISKCAVRVSFSRYNTMDEIETAAKKIAYAAKHIRTQKKVKLA